MDRPAVSSSRAPEAPPPPSWSRRRSRRRWPRRRPGRSRAAASPTASSPGDPTPKGISLWTRFDPSASGGPARRARGRHRQVLPPRRRAQAHHDRRRRPTTRSRRGSAGLKAHEQYYYRFATRAPTVAVGRFRTALPADSKEPVKFAFFSCQDYTHGYYNALERRWPTATTTSSSASATTSTPRPITRSRAAPASATTRSAARTRQPGIVREAVTLADYRAKYQLYRSDPPLRAVHAKFPMVMLWDDHEVQDNYAGKPRRRRPAGRQALQPRAQDGGPQGVLRDDARLRPAASGSTASCRSAPTST